MAFANAQVAVAALASRTASLADLREIVTRFPELRPVVAAYPQTDAALLEWLGGLHEPLIDVQLAKRSAGATDEGAVADTKAWSPAAEEAEATSVVPVEETVVAPHRDPTDQDSIFRPDPNQSPGSDVAAPRQAPAAPQLIQSHPGPQAAPPQPAASWQPSYPSQPAPQGQPTYTYPGQPPYGSGYLNAPPAQPPIQPIAEKAPSGKPKRRVLPVVLIGLLALVLIGGGVGVAFATGLIGAPASKAAGQPSLSSTPSGPPSSASPAASTPANPTPSDTPSSSAALPTPAATLCWDGSTITDGSACPAPSGKDADWSYLQYAYPSIATHSDCQQVSSTGNGAYKKPTVMWECELGDALIRYRYWEGLSDAEHHYGTKFTKKTTLASYDVTIGGAPANGWIKTDKKTTDGPGGVKRVVLTMWLPDQHLSMSVEGNTKSSMWAAFDLARIRPLAQILGHPDGTDPDEAALTAVGR